MCVTVFCKKYYHKIVWFEICFNILINLISNSSFCSWCFLWIFLKFRAWNVNMYLRNKTWRSKKLLLFVNPHVILFTKTLFHNETNIWNTILHSQTIAQTIFWKAWQTSYQILCNNDIILNDLLFSYYTVIHPKYLFHTIQSMRQTHFTLVFQSRFTLPFTLLHIVVKLALTFKYNWMWRKLYYIYRNSSGF